MGRKTANNVKTETVASDDKCSEKNEDRGGVRLHLQTRGVRVNFTEKVTLEQRPKGGEGGSYASIWEKVFRQREQQVPSPWGRNVAGGFEEQQGGQCDWDRVSEGTVGEMRVGTG